jgi:hypothetical protein
MGQPMTYDWHSRVLEAVVHDAVENLRSEIEKQYGSISNFSSELNIDRSNLNQCLLHKQMISVGLFVKCCHHLVLFPGVFSPIENAAFYSVRLDHFMMIDGFAIHQCIHLLSHS